MISFTQFQYFLVVAEEKNFTRAAKRLFISQQSLSMHIQSIEKELNTKLFERTVPLKLTESGLVFQKYSREFTQSYQEMCKEINDINQQQKGSYRFGISHNRGEILLPLLLPILREEFPCVDFYIVEAKYAELQEKLVRGEIDLIIEQLPFSNDKIASVPLCQDRLCMLLSEGFLKSHFGNGAKKIKEKLFSTGRIIPELSDCPFLLNNIGNSIRSKIETILISEGIEPECKIATENMNTLLNLCANDYGITFYPELFLYTPTKNLTPKNVYVIPLTYDITKYTLGIGYRKGAYLSKVSTRIGELVKQFSTIS